MVERVIIRRWAHGGHFVFVFMGGGGVLLDGGLTAGIFI